MKGSRSSDSFLLVVNYVSRGTVVGHSQSIYDMCIYGLQLLESPSKEIIQCREFVTSVLSSVLIVR